MKKMLFCGVIAVVFVAVVADEVRLHRVVQRQNVAVERLTAEVGDLQRASADREKRMTATPNLAFTPKGATVTTNGPTTIFGVTPRNPGRRGEFPFASPSLQESPDKVPSNWEPFEFNGRTYYRIPLAYTSPEPLVFKP